MFNKNFGKQILGAKIQNQKGKSPNFQLRFSNYNSWIKFKSVMKIKR